MKVDNKISRNLSGPSIFIGLTFAVLGLVFIFDLHFLFGTAFLLIASFLFFTYSGVEIDTNTKKIKSYNKVFGIIKLGKWESMEKYRGLTLVPMKRVQTIFSRSNRQTSSTDHYFQIYLLNKASKPQLAIKKCNNIETAQNSIDEFSIWLKMPVFSVKK